MAGLLKIKSRFKESLTQVLPEPQASLASGILLGAKRGLPDEWRDRFNQVGLSHIIVISGMHMSIVVAVLAVLLTGKMSRRLVFILMVLMIISFVLLTGAAASAMRAGVMAVLVLIAFNAGRLGRVQNALALAAAGMLLLNPRLLAADISFQLSFLATISIVAFAKPLGRWFSFIPTSFGLRGALVMSLAAQVLVLPLIVYHFGRLSFISPLANLLALPAVPLAMFTSFAGGIAGLFNAGAGQVAALPAWLFLTYVMRVSEWLGNLPSASMEIGKFSVWWLVVYYGAWIGIAILLTRNKKRKKEV
jgi:competence protein ComEC